MVRVDAGIAPEDLRLVRQGPGLHLYFDAGGTQLRDLGMATHPLYVGDPFAGPSVGRIEFADGTVWDSEQIRARSLRGASEGDDRVIGFDASGDLIEGLGGNDSLDGRAGDDLLRGGAGDDVLSGGLGDDRLEGGAGRDQLAGGAGADVLVGDDGDDALQGGEGIDTLFGGAGADRLAGDDGDDFLVGGEGDDVLIGGPGRDVVDFARGGGGDVASGVEFIRLPDALPGEVLGGRTSNELRLAFDNGDRLSVLGWEATLEAIEFADGTLWGPAEFGALTRLATEGDDELHGTQADDVLEGLAGNDSLFGFAGDDLLDGGPGADLMAGGSGNDTYRVDDVEDFVVELAGEGLDAIDAFVDTAMPPEVEILALRGTSAFAGFGNAGDNHILGNDNDNWLSGEAGDDLLEGGAGEDMLSGGEGDDTLRGGAGFDVLEGGAGADRYVFETGDGPDLIIDEAGAANRVVLQGVSPRSVAIFFEAGEYFLTFGDEVITLTNAQGEGVLPVASVHFDDGTVWTEADLADRMNLPPNGEPSAGDDFLVGTPGDDTLRALEGNDQLLGRSGTDLLEGGPGSDSYYFLAGDGWDTIVDVEGSPEEVDALIFGPGIASAAMTVSFDGSALTLAVDPENAVTVLWDRARGVGIETVIFEDGTQWDREGLDALASVPANRAPELVLPIVDALAREDEAFERALAPGTFADPDEGEVLVYTAAQADGQPLPAWLSFDPDTATFAGQPGNQDVGDASIVVTASDREGLSVVAGFTLVVQNVNDVPRLERPLADQTALEDQPLAFSVPLDAFGDEDAGDTLVLRAELGAGAPLPPWLEFSTHTASFAGTPGNEDVGTLSVRVVATDSAGAEADDAFELVVRNVNDAPQAGPAPDPQFVEAGGQASFGVPETSFFDPDAGDALTLAAALDGGEALPAWLRFDPGAGSFDVAPPDSAMGVWRVQLTARDASGAQADTGFNLTVAAPAGRATSGGRGDDVLVGGSGNERLSGGSGDDYLAGLAGNDRLVAGRGNDVLQGGEGRDALVGGRGRSVLDGGAGNDSLRGNAGASVLVGGPGNDDIRPGSGTDVILFHRGDGRDTIHLERRSQAVLSVGGIGADEVALRRLGQHLVVDFGNGDAVEFANWYRRRTGVATLQIIGDGVAGSGASSADASGLPRVETFDFRGLVTRFDTQARGASAWAIAGALADFALAASDDAAFGGDLAVWYGQRGSLGGLPLSVAREGISGSTLGVEAQPLRAPDALGGGFVTLTP